MNVDLSAAPEIAQLAHRRPPPPHAPASPASPASPATPAPTLGALSRELGRLAATPQRWWDLVRFDPEHPVRIPLPVDPAQDHEAWLLVMPPGGAGECACHMGTLIAGGAAEDTTRLRPGRILVHGSRRAHAIRGVGQGYSVSLHLGSSRFRSVEKEFLSRTRGADSRGTAIFRLRGQPTG